MSIRYIDETGQPIVISGSKTTGIPEAPIDDTQYARRNANWYPLPTIPNSFERTYKPDKMLSRTRNVLFSGTQGDYGIGMADGSVINDVGESDYKVAVTADTPTTILKYTDNGLFKYKKGQKIYVQLFVMCQTEAGEEPNLTITTSDGTIIGESEEFGLEYFTLFGNIRVLQGHIAIIQDYTSASTDVMDVNISSAISQDYVIRVGNQTYMSYIEYDPKVEVSGDSKKVTVIDTTTQYLWDNSERDVNVFLMHVIDLQKLFLTPLGISNFKGNIFMSIGNYLTGTRYTDNAYFHTFPDAAKDFSKALIYSRPLTSGVSLGNPNGDWFKLYPDPHFVTVSGSSGLEGDTGARYPTWGTAETFPLPIRFTCVPEESMDTWNLILCYNAGQTYV